MKNAVQDDIINDNKKLILWLSWIATIILTVATTLRATGGFPYWDLICTAIGLTLWGAVGVMQKNLPLILTNALGGIIAFIGIIMW